MISPKELWSLVKQSLNAWLEDRAASMGAALSYYTGQPAADVGFVADGKKETGWTRSRAHPAVRSNGGRQAPAAGTYLMNV